MAGKLPKDYIGPKQRVRMLKKDHADSAVVTEVSMQVVGDSLCLLVKASIEVNGKVIATGHAFTAEPEEDKELEKTETTAIGRALVNAGYPETLAESDDPEALEGEEEAPKPVKKSGGLGGLGSKPVSKQTSVPVKKPSVVEEDTEEGEEEAESEVQETAVAVPVVKAEVTPPQKPKMTKEELLARFPSSKKV